MKNTYTIEERNRIVEEHLWCVKAVMRQNNAVIRAARMDRDDVYQQLCLRLILAAGRYDPEKSELSSYILRQLQYELLSCKTSHMPCGIKNAPKELRYDSFVSLDAKDAGTYLDSAMAA